jgi:hypothetical protein
VCGRPLVSPVAIGELGWEELGWGELGWQWRMGRPRRWRRWR